MITSIELGDFLSHSNTKLEFENGVTVFVGHNGAGKSSIIDAITFALFGEHTRKSNKGLIKRGAIQGFSKVNFTVNGKSYEAVRKIDSKGSLAAKFSEIAKGNKIEIAAGERRQFGESMTAQIEKTIGLDFEKLKIASIVQQGELNAIINAKPKEFKELLNAIIGINKLDIASESMKTVNKDFRAKIREKVGYDDTHMDILTRDLENHEIEIKQAIPEKAQLELEQKRLEKHIEQLQSEIENESPKVEKINQLSQRKKELLDYAKSAIREIQQEIVENERKIRDCKGCFKHANTAEDLEVKIQMVENAIEDTSKKRLEITNQIASLREKELLASKLQLLDNKCPVCDSKVEKLNPLFEEQHIKEEISRLQQDKITKENEMQVYEQKRKEFASKLQNARDARATLKAHSISNESQLLRIQEETNAKKIKSNLNTESIIEISQIDSHASMIHEHIKRLESETVGFNQDEFIRLKNNTDKKQIELSQIHQKIGGISEKISKNNERILKIKDALTELQKVKEYVDKLDKIQSNIFSRDGSVATSLRSWALNTISAKTSEYLTLLNTKIQRILLSEKTRDISITCYSKNEVLELESLSGGEKVSVALALRLGMASLLGASNLNLMILDEPTTHLDAERKKSLVGVLSQLSNIANSETPMQFLIITHDAEIFEDSTVEQIYKFESSEHGSRVISL